jgi:hypothetical protein
VGAAPIHADDPATVDRLSRFRAHATLRPQAMPLRLDTGTASRPHRSVNVQSLFDHYEPSRHRCALADRQQVRWQPTADVDGAHELLSVVCDTLFHGRSGARRRRRSLSSATKLGWQFRDMDTIGASSVSRFRPISGSQHEIQADAQAVLGLRLPDRGAERQRRIRLKSARNRFTDASRSTIDRFIPRWD